MFWKPTHSEKEGKAPLKWRYLDICTLPLYREGSAEPLAVLLLISNLLLRTYRVEKRSVLLLPVICAVYKYSQSQFSKLLTSFKIPAPFYA